jgi:WD40 repeat protein
LSWALLSYGLRHGSQPTLTSSPQKGISSGKLLCSVSYGTNAQVEPGQPLLGWSALGVIATSDPFLKTFSAQTCASQSLIHLPTTAVRPVWSPDGKRLLLLAGDTAKVLDASTGSLLASFQAGRSTGFVQAVWVSNGTQIISSEVNVLSHTTQSVKIQIWDASTGALVRTAFTFNDGILIGSAWISPNGRYLAVQMSDHKITFWNIGTGTVVSTTTSSVAGNSQPVTWSPDGTSLAVGLPNANWPVKPSEVQIWSSATGQLSASFQDSHTFEGNIGGLAWSPDGKYLAESSAEIHIWDVAARKLVATFGKIATKTTSSSGKTTTFFQVSSVTWAPDGSRLASITTSYAFPPVPGASNRDTLNVWQLSWFTLHG